MKALWNKLCEMFRDSQKFEDEVVVFGHPADTAHHGKKISEPVISFVEFLKTDPENFLVSRDGYEFSSFGSSEKFKLVDTKNRKVYKYTIFNDVYNRVRDLSVNSIYFLTHEECKYLLQTHDWGVERMAAKARMEKEAADIAQREEYKKIYCNVRDNTGEC